MLNAFFRLGEQQILRGILRFDTVLLSKWEHKLDVYTDRDKQWQAQLPFISGPTRMVRSAYEIARAYNWLGTDYAREYSGLGEVEQYAVAYTNWIGWMQ